MKTKDQTFRATAQFWRGVNGMTGGARRARAAATAAATAAGAAQLARNGARLIGDVTAFIKAAGQAGGGSPMDHQSAAGAKARAAGAGRRWKGDKRRAQRARASALRADKRAAAAAAAALVSVAHPDRAVVATVLLRQSVPRHVWIGDERGAVWSALGFVGAAAALVSVAFGSARYVPAEDRLGYAAWWSDRPMAAVAAAARRAARSCRGGKVSATSRDEAAAAARSVFVSAAAVLVAHGVADWYDAPLWATVSATAQRAAVAAARASMRGDGRGGIVGRDSEGVEIIPDVISGPDGDPVSPVWDMGRGDWASQERIDDGGGVKVCPFKRAGAVELLDQAGRLIVDERGAVSDEDAAASVAIDAVKLCDWLAARRMDDTFRDKVAALGVPVTQGRVSAQASARVRGLAMAGKVAAVLSAMAGGDSLPVACLSVGWSDADACGSWRRAVSRLTAGAGLASAWRDYRAAERAGV